MPYSYRVGCKRPAHTLHSRYSNVRRSIGHAAVSPAVADLVHGRGYAPQTVPDAETKSGDRSEAQWRVDYRSHRLVDSPQSRMRPAAAALRRAAHNHWRPLATS